MKNFWYQFCSALVSDEIMPVWISLISVVICVFVIKTVIVANEKKKPVQTVCGKIIERQASFIGGGVQSGVIYIVECADASRVRVSAGGGELMNLVIGDEGEFTYRGAWLIKFVRTER